MKNMKQISFCALATGLCIANASTSFALSLNDNPQSSVQIQQDQPAAKERGIYLKAALQCPLSLKMLQQQARWERSLWKYTEIIN